MSISLEAAAEVMRQAMRDTVKRHSLWYLLQGGLMILGGILALAYPVITSVAVVTLLGWVLIVSGIVQGLSIIGARNVPHFWLQAISVGLSVIVGLLFLSNPAGEVGTISLLLIVFFVVEGIAKIIFALTIRPFPNWGWVLASGVLGVVVAFILWASLPGTALWVLGLLLGLQLIGEGAAIGYLAWEVRTDGRPKPLPPIPAAAPPPSDSPTT
jgi:uncharacterized membrane protein HdeD (DUF308 family)